MRLDFTASPNPATFEFTTGGTDRMCTNIPIVADGIFENELEDEYFFCDLNLIRTDRVVVEPKRTQVNIIDSDLYSKCLSLDLLHHRKCHISGT